MKRMRFALLVFMSVENLVNYY